MHTTYDLAEVDYLDTMYNVFGKVDCFLRNKGEMRGIWNINAKNA